MSAEQKPSLFQNGSQVGDKLLILDQFYWLGEVKEVVPGGLVLHKLTVVIHLGHVTKTLNTNDIEHMQDIEPLKPNRTMFFPYPGVAPICPWEGRLPSPRAL